MTLLPEIVGRLRQARHRIAIRHHPVRRPLDQRRVDRRDVLHVPVPLEMLPERPEYQRGLVLLDRELRLAVLHPRVPRARERAVRIVLVEKISFRREELAAEPEELAGELRIARHVQRVSHQRAVPRPQVRIGVSRLGRDVRVVRRNDRAAVVHLGPDHQQAPVIEVRDLLGQLAEVDAVLVQPVAPVLLRPQQVILRQPLLDPLVQVVHAEPVLTRNDPIPGLLRPLRRHRQIDAERGVHRALGDRAGLQLAVLRVSPGPLRPFHLLAARGEVLHPDDPVRHVIGEKVAAHFVMGDGLVLGFVGRRVADLGLVEVEVLVDEQADVALPVGQVPDDDLPDVDRVVEVHGVGAEQPDLQSGMIGLNARDHRPLFVLEGDLPVRAQPGEPAVHPHPEAGGMADRLVLLADVRVVDVADAVVAVEGDEELAVAERDVPRHAAYSEVAKAASFG